MRLIERAGLGDGLMLTAFVREYKRAFPDEMIFVESERQEIWEHNPRLNIGNSENGLTFNLAATLKAFMGHFPRKTARDMGFEMLDLRPEIFLTEKELAIEYWPQDGRRVAAIDLAAGWRSRAWPGACWQDVASRLLDEGWAVIEVGASKDPRPSLPHTWTFVNRHSIRETAAVLGRCDLFLGNDSGLLHLAAAVGTPQVVLFGPVRYAARGYESTEPIEAAEACPPACGFKCSKSKDGSPACLKTFTAEDVLSAADRAITRGRRPQ